jgi:MFS family permease
MILIFISLSFFLRISSKPLPPSEDSESIGKRLTAGIKFVFANELILTAISLDLFAVLFGGAIALLPIYASEILNVGAKGLGFLRACPGIGAIMMMIWLAYHPIRKNAGRKMLWAVSGFGLTIILFGISENFWLSSVLLILSGVFDSISVIVRHNLIHLKTPEYLKGRVSAVNSIFIGSSNELGAFESGTLAGIIGTVTAVVTGGVITLVITGIAAWKVKQLRTLEL